MSRSRVPSYRLHRPTGLAVVSLGGKDHYLGKHGTGFSGQFTKLPSLRRLELSRSRSGSGRFRSIRLIRFPFVFDACRWTCLPSLSFLPRPHLRARSIEQSFVIPLANLRARVGR